MFEVLLVVSKVLLKLELELAAENFINGIKLNPAIIYVRDETDSAFRSSKIGFVIVDSAFRSQELVLL